MDQLSVARPGKTATMMSKTRGSREPLPPSCLDRFGAGREHRQCSEPAARYSYLLGSAMAEPSDCVSSTVDIGRNMCTRSRAGTAV